MYMKFLFYVQLGVILLQMEHLVYLVQQDIFALKLGGRFHYAKTVHTLLITGLIVLFVPQDTVALILVHYQNFVRRVRIL